MKAGKKSIFTFSILLLSTGAFAQSENKHIRKGNSLYYDGKYTESHNNYLKALEENSKSFSGAFNLADALYKQENYEEAANQFSVLSNSAPDKILKAKAFHNQGNSLLQAKKLEESITAYKNALRNNPKDDDSRYNLAYAQQLLKQQQEQEKQDEQKEDKKEDKKDKEENKDKKEQDQKEKEEEQKEQEQQQPKKDQLSKEEAQRLLDALNNEEQKVQDKLNKKKVGVKVQIEKDW